MTSLTKMLCLVDGEHYLPVTQEAIDTLNNNRYKILTSNLKVMELKLYMRLNYGKCKHRS